VLNTFIPGRATAQQGAKESLCTETDRITLFDGKFEKADEVLLYDGLKILDLADVKLVSDKIVPSFTSYGLTLEHELQIEICGACADREFQGTRMGKSLLRCRVVGRSRRRGVWGSI
jgi:hypothetical protein